MTGKTIAITLLPLCLLLFFGPAISSASAQDSVCVQCHGGQTGRLGEPVASWRGSIHAGNGISCHSCHGGDPTDMTMAMSPERGFIGVPAEEEIPGFCGRCHVGVEEDYLASAHGRALWLEGPTCVTCHGNHAVEKASPGLINRADCSRCHEYGRAEEIKSAVEETDAQLAGLEAELAALGRIGIEVREEKGEVFALRNDFHRLFHSVDVDRVRSETAAFRREIAAIGEEIGLIEKRLDRRRVAGAVVVGLLVLCGFLFMLMRKTYEEEEG